MKKIAIAISLMLLASTNAAHAAKHGLGYKLTHLHIAHKVAVVAGAPFYVAGFAFETVGGLVYIPFKTAQKDFKSRPFVSF